MRACIDRMDPVDPEVPLEFGLQERRDEAARGGVDVNRYVQARIGLDPVKRGSDRVNWLVHAGVGGTHDRDQADGVLVDVGGEVVPVEC